MNLTHARLPFALPKVKLGPGVFLGGIILTALLAFEMFNYSTTDFALRDLLGDLKFFGFRWATILAIAFCGIDFAGIARLFTPEQGADEPKEVWYLFGAWFLAATMNALLTWWGVAMAVASHEIQSTTILEPETLIKIVPVFVAVMVWVIRILIIGSISVAGERIFSSGKRTNRILNDRPNANRQTPVNRPRPMTAAPLGSRPIINRSLSSSLPETPSRPEATYHRMQ